MNKLTANLVDSMKGYIVKHKTRVIVLAVLLFMYVTIPMVVLTQYPFRIFNVAPNRVAVVELTYEDKRVVINNPDAVVSFVDKLNGRRYFFWRPVPLRGGESYRVTLYNRNYDVVKSLSCYSNVAIDYGICFSTNMEFVTSRFSE